MNFQMFKLDLEKAEISNMLWIIKKAREFQKTIYFCFIDYAKAFDCVDNKGSSSQSYGFSSSHVGCESSTVKKAE